MELLRVTYVAKGDLVEWIGLINQHVLFVFFFNSSCMRVAWVGTTPRTAYSAALTQGLISFQKNPELLALKLLIILETNMLIMVILQYRDIFYWSK